MRGPHLGRGSRDVASGAKGIRTPDLCRARAALCQLSYRPWAPQYRRQRRANSVRSAGQALRRFQRVLFSIFLCLCLRIFLRRFLITEPTKKQTSNMPSGRWWAETNGSLTLVAAQSTGPRTGASISKWI